MGTAACDEFGPLPASGEPGHEYPGVGGLSQCVLQRRALVVRLEQCDEFSWTLFVLSPRASKWRRIRRRTKPSWPRNTGNAVQTITLVNSKSGKLKTFNGLNIGPDGAGAANGLAVDSRTGIACTTTELNAQAEFYDLAKETGIALQLPDTGLAANSTAVLPLRAILKTVSSWSRSPTRAPAATAAYTCMTRAAI